MAEAKPDESMLSDRERQVLAFVRAFAAANGYAPTQREVGTACGYKDGKGAEYPLGKLQRLGFIAAPAGRGKARAIQVRDWNRIRIPSLGVAGAGPGVENLDDSRDDLDLTELFGRPGLATVRVSGGSMDGDGILDGDHAVVRVDPEPRSGETVLCLVDGELLLKEFRQHGDRIALYSREKGGRRQFREVDPATQDVAVLGVYYSLVRVPKALRKG